MWYLHERQIYQFTTRCYNYCHIRHLSFVICGRCNSRSDCASVRMWHMTNFAFSSTKVSEIMKTIHCLKCSCDTANSRFIMDCWMFLIFLCKGDILRYILLCQLTLLRPRHLRTGDICHMSYDVSAARCQPVHPHRLIWWLRCPLIFKTDYNGLSADNVPLRSDCVHLQTDLELHWPIVTIQYIRVSVVCPRGQNPGGQYWIFWPQLSELLV